VTRLLAALTFGLALGAHAAPRDYVVDPDASRIRVHVGRSGLFKFAGHTHEVEAPVHAGRVSADPDDPSRSTLSFSVRSEALRVTGEGEPADDVPKVQARMQGPDVLDAARHPEIAFQSRSVSAIAAGAGAWDVTVVGDLTLHGTTRPVTLRGRVAIAGERLSASGTAELRQTAFGNAPISVGGVVNVKDQLRIDWTLAATAR
jgi:polyisoprenoid-binding protein YceI